MTKWHTVSVKVSTEEKKVLSDLNKMYGMNSNEFLKGSFEFLVRWMIATEVSIRENSYTANKIREVGEKYNKLMESEINEVLKTIPKEQQKKDWEQYSGKIINVFELFDEIFVKNRLRGRRPLERKRGRPIDTGITS